MTTTLAAPSSLPKRIEDSTVSRPSPLRQRSSSLLHKNALSRMRPLPFQYVFTFWHSKSRSSAPTILAESVPDIAEFYKIYNNFPYESLALKDGIHFFRSGVKPLWEDPENSNGGCWTLKVRKDDGRALKTWEELCLMVCGGELQAAVSKGESCDRNRLSVLTGSDRDHVLGISWSPRLFVAHISIWTKQGGNKASIETLQRTILSRLSEELRPAIPSDYYYKQHKDHVDFTAAVTS